MDQQHASHAEGSAPAEFLKRVDPPDYVLPFAAGSFDFVYSTSVMEHVLDPGVEAAREPPLRRGVLG